MQMITKEDVLQAQQAWADAIVAQSSDDLATLYDFDDLLFKPTMAPDVRTDEAGALSYFIGGNTQYPGDKGFLHHGFTNVDFQSARGPVLTAGGVSAQDMDHYFFKAPDGSLVKADYSFVYKKTQGKTLITLHHSSFNVADAG